MTDRYPAHLYDRDYRGEPYKHLLIFVTLLDDKYKLSIEMCDPADKSQRARTADNCDLSASLNIFSDGSCLVFVNEAQEEWAVKALKENYYPSIDIQYTKKGRPHFIFGNLAEETAFLVECGK